MRLRTLTVHGISPAYRASTVTLDVEALRGPLVAVTGANGAGKSVLLGSWPGALYRDVPTRGSLVDLARAAGVREAYVEVEVDTPARLRIRQTVDGLSKVPKGESLVTDGSGAPVLDSASVRAFDDWAALNLPPASVFLSTMFTAQGSAGWVGMTASERRAVVLRALGIERMERMAAAARERAASAEEDLLAHGAQIEAERRHVDFDAEARLSAAHVASEAAYRDELAAIHALRGAQEAFAALDRAFRAAEETRAHRLTALGTLDEAKAAVTRLERELARVREVLADASNVRAAAAGVADLRATVAATRERREQARAAAVETGALVARLELEVTNTEAAWTHAERRLQVADAAARGLDAAEAAAKALPGLRAEVENAEAAVAELEAATLDVAGKRITALRKGLESIEAPEPENLDAESLSAIAHETLSTDDRMANRAAEAPGKLDACRDRLRSTRVDLHRAEQAAATLASLRAHAAEADGARQDRANADGDLAELRPRLKDERLRLDLRNRASSEAFLALTAIERRLAAAETAADALPALERTDERRAALERDLERCREAVRIAEKALEQWPEVPAAQPVPDIAKQEEAVKAARERHAGAERLVAAAEAALESARAARARVAALEHDRAGIEAALADWRKLADDLGQKGLIALEVDAAGPELSTIATSLVHECFGTRWTLSITTTRAKADGSGATEVCDVTVLDTVDGTETTIDRKSGGQLVVLSQAVRLALLTVACRRVGVTGATLVLDESSAALDAESRGPFVAMLRRAAALVGAEKVLLVTHDEETASLCDSRVRVGGGALTIE